MADENTLKFLNLQESYTYIDSLSDESIKNFLRLCISRMLLTQLGIRFENNKTILPSSDFDLLYFCQVMFYIFQTDSKESIVAILQGNGLNNF